eukprot:scaffold215392_cov19-Tisochrysis_lutea.AAC.2
MGLHFATLSALLQHTGIHRQAWDCALPLLVHYCSTQASQPSMGFATPSAMLQIVASTGGMIFRSAILSAMLEHSGSHK